MTDERTPDLYWISGSPPSWRVMLGLTLKRVAFHSRRLDHAAGENRTAAYLAVNPTGRVPTLRHGSLTVRESIAILAYLDRAWSRTPLFGHGPAEAAAIWQRVMTFECDLRPAATVLAATLLSNRSASRRDELRTAEAAYLGALDELDGHLSRHAFLGPEGPAAADCWLFPTLGWIDRALGRTTDARPADLVSHVTDRPAIAHWRDRFGALPGVAGTLPPHWADAPANPKRGSSRCSDTTARTAHPTPRRR